MSENEEIIEEINSNEAGINLGKNDDVNNSNFNKFFEETNEEIVVETLEQSDEVEGEIDDDTIYEIDVYNNLISGLSLVQQNNPKIQEKYLKLARHLINLKNKSKTVDLGDLEDYSDIKKIYKNEFNVSWILPVVLDKKKIYKKLDIGNSDSSNEVIESYINTASNKGIQYEDFFDELKKETKYIDEFNREKMTYKTYRKLTYDIDQPYIIKKEMKKKELGYNLYLNQFSELLRYFNLDNKFWQKYINNGPEKFTYEVYDEDNKRIGSKEAQVLSGAYVNIIGLLVLGSKEDNILDALNGQPWFDRIRKIGEATKIIKNEQAIIEMKNHGLKNGDKIMISNSNSEPSVDGEFTVKIINDNQFMVPVNIEDGKEGTTAEIFSTTVLNFKKIELNKKILDLDTKEDYGDKYLDSATLYLFPEEEINDEEWKQMCKKIIPRAGAIIENQKNILENAKTIDEINSVLKKFSVEFQNLGWDDYFTITEILDDKYIEERDKQSKFNYDKFYGEIISMREKIIGDKNEEKVEDDIIFGNKFILNKDVIKYYGNYPNLGTDVDSIAARYNWIYGSPDYGKFYFLNMELEKIKAFEDISIKDAEELIKKINSQIKEAEKETKNGSDKSCEKRKIEPVKIYESYNKVFDDKGKITEFNIGDYAIIENDKAHENGMIFVWNGINWTQNILIKSLDDLCLLGVEKIKDFDLEKLHCLFKKACKNKKQVRAERKIERLENELSLLQDLTNLTTKEIEKKLLEEIKIAELNLQIYMRQIEDTRPKETITIYEQDIDPIYMDILKIPDTDTREYLRNLLIKKDGILIDKDIYSIRTGKKICCGHFYYQLKIASGGSPEYSEKITQEMNAIYGTEEENGMIFCSHDGAPLFLMDYDTAEGLSKTTGEVDKQRELVIDEEQEIKEQIMELQSDEREAEIFECSSAEIRNELLKTGFKMEQVAKAKDICAKINTLNGKTGIILKKREFINIIIDVLQIFQKIPDFTRFKHDEIIGLKKRGIDLKTISSKIFAQRYTDLITVRKTTLVAARLLITYQTLIPPQYPTGKKTGVIFEGFEGNNGLEYLALLIEEAKIMPITKLTKNGKEVTMFLQLGKVKEEIRRSYDELSDLTTVKKMKKDKKIYESKQIKVQEEKVGVVTREVPKIESLPKNFQKEVEKARKYSEFYSFQKELRGRQKYIAYEIIKSINESVATSTDRQSDDPKSIEMSCCFQTVDEELDYYKFISEKTNKNIYELLEESQNNSFYNDLFLNGGIVMKHYPKQNANFHLKITNLGYNNDSVRKHLFLTYISKGVFKGEKHEWSDGLCLITGESEQDVLKNTYTNEEEDDLIKVIIRKSVKKIIIGGSNEDEKLMKERNESLIDNLDLEKMKKESMDNLGKEINNFVEKMGRLLNKTSNKDFMNNFRERIESLGLYNKVLDVEREQVERTGKSSDVISFENDKFRMRISNLKKYFNNYFRRYISIVANMYDPTEHIKQIVDIEEATSRELQKYIFDREYFIKKYLTKRDSEVFQKLQFNISSKVISNISAETDIWDKSYSKIEKIVNFNLSHLSDVLLYVLIQNLDNFITLEFEKGVEKNKMIAQFILEIFDKIYADENQLDYSPGIFIDGDYRAQEEKIGEEPEKVKDEATRMIAELNYKFKKVSDQTDYEEVYDELDSEERKETMKLKFIKDYKSKFDKDPTDNEIIDYLETQENEEKIDKEEDQEEWMLTKLNDEDDESPEIGNEYGEMAQGGEGEDGDY